MRPYFISFLLMFLPVCVWGFSSEDDFFNPELGKFVIKVAASEKCTEEAKNKYYTPDLKFYSSADLKGEPVIEVKDGGVFFDGKKEISFSMHDMDYINDKTVEKIRDSNPVEISGDKSTFFVKAKSNSVFEVKSGEKNIYFDLRSLKGYRKVQYSVKEDHYLELAFFSEPKCKVLSVYSYFPPTKGKIADIEKRAPGLSQLLDTMLGCVKTQKLECFSKYVLETNDDSKSVYRFSILGIGRLFDPINGDVPKSEQATYNMLPVSENEHLGGRALTYIKNPKEFAYYLKRFKKEIALGFEKEKIVLADLSGGANSAYPLWVQVIRKISETSLVQYEVYKLSKEGEWKIGQMQYRYAGAGFTYMM